MGKLVIRTITVGKIDRKKDIADMVIREGSQIVARFECPYHLIGEIISCNL